MKKILTSLVLLLVATASQAQRITVVDSNGNGIHLVTVLSEDGNMIGITKYKRPLSLDKLEGYAASHGIPAIVPTLRKAIDRLPKKS